ncbi:MAG: fimbrillin family protein [Dysgonamonadaceae bacterium]|jgi:hypothetical protein|nr:fimbrillin family protein [Dysgonamonadaceae bacterium]
MKHTFWKYPALFAAGMMMMTSCTQDEEFGGRESGRAVEFRMQGGMSGLRTTTTTKDYIRSFVVNGVNDDSGSKSYVMQGTTVYRGEDNKWSYSPLVYFPTANSDFVEFHAYSPAGSKNLTAKLGASAVGSQEIAYTVPAPDKTNGATLQEDFLVAYEKVDKSAYAQTVKLQFRHALSRILVAAQSPDPVTVTGLKLVNLYGAGTLSLAGNTATGTDPSTGIPASTGSGQTAWSYLPVATATSDYVTLWQTSGQADQAYEYVLPASGVSVGTTDALLTSKEQGMFVLPQTTDANFGLEIKYLKSGTTAEQTVTVKFSDIYSIANTVTFEIGRQYVLHLNFADLLGSRITFEDIDVDNSGADNDVPKVWKIGDRYSNNPVQIVNSIGPNGLPTTVIESTTVQPTNFRTALDALKDAIKNNIFPFSWDQMSADEQKNLVPTFRALPAYTSWLDALYSSANEIAVFSLTIYDEAIIFSSNHSVGNNVFGFNISSRNGNRYTVTVQDENGNITDSESGDLSLFHWVKIVSLP